MLQAFVAILLSLLHAAAIGFISFVLVAWALFPWENQDDPTSDDWLIAVAAVLFASVLPLLVTVLARRRIAAAIALAAHVAVAIALLVGALGESEHSDGRLLALAVGVEGTAVIAYALRFGGPAGSAPRSL